jgi:hypothetical protein
VRCPYGCIEGVILLRSGYYRGGSKPVPCPSCSCWCGQPNTNIGGMCERHEREDFIDEDTRALRREDGAGE